MKSLMVCVRDGLPPDQFHLSSPEYSSLNLSALDSSHQFREPKY